MTRFFYSFLFLIAHITVFFLICNSAKAAMVNPLEMRTEDEKLVKWDLSAETITSLGDSEIIEAKGGVYLRRGDEYLKADFARYYTSTKWIFLSGNVKVRMNQDELTAEEAEFDLRSRVGWLKKGKIFIAASHAYISGEYINKHWGDVYTFKQAKVTTCDGDVPAWSIIADEAIVEVDGYARMSGSAFQVKNQSVVYTPYFLFPTKTTRQSGLLLPEYGRSSIKGTNYYQPFFWAIDESNDLTLSEMFMEKRGFMHGLQYRTHPSSDTTGWLRFDWLYDRKKETTDSGNFAGDGLVRNNNERYWLRGMYDTKVFDQSWSFKADLDYVSDQYFLSEFESGKSGYSQSRNELFSFFRRDIKEKDQDRVSGVLLNKNWERGSVALSAQYTQAPWLGNGNSPHSQDNTVQRLPQFDAFLYKGKITPSLPIEAEGKFQGSYLFRRSGTKGARYLFNPRLTLPITTKYGSIIASGGVSHMLYSTEYPSHSTEDRQGPKESKETRTIPDIEIAASTEFAKIYTFASKPLLASNSTMGNHRYVSMRHSIQPRIEYIHRPSVNQEDNPYYDEEDRLTAITDIKYSLTNVLTKKKETVVMEKNKSGKAVPVVKTSYADLLRLRIEQTYDYRESFRESQKEKYPRRPFGDVVADLNLNVNDYLTLVTRNNWSPYEKSFTRHQSGVSLSFPEYGNIYAGYDLRKKIDEYTRKREDELRYLQLSASTKLFDPISLSASYRYDLRDHTNKELDLNLAYNYECFTLIGQYTKKPKEKNYTVMVILTGLGD